MTDRSAYTRAIDATVFCYLLLREIEHNILKMQTFIEPEQYCVGILGTAVFAKNAERLEAD